jgi:hypothetical protein
MTIPSASISRLLLIVFILCQGVLFAQKNTSSEDNYQQRIASTLYKYSTNYDAGYVKLLDGTLLNGKISLVGDSYERLSLVRFQSNNGKKYVFRLRSLSEFGLTNSLVNDTPKLFTWERVNEKSLFTGFQDILTGTADFGYVNTKDGKTHEGKLTIKEANGKIESIQVKDYNKGNIKLEAEQISNFGAKTYSDEKFDGVFSIIKWRSSGGTGMLANTKSVPIKGVLNLNNGQQKKGYLTLVKKDENITSIFVSESPKSKREKFKYNDVKSYTLELYKKDYLDMVYGGEQPREEIHPSALFHPGALALVDGTIKEGLVAKGSNSDFSDIFFLEDENAKVEEYLAENIETVAQIIPEQDINEYHTTIYNRDHVMGYRKQNPPRWDIGKRTSNGYETNFQPGYLILKNGEVKFGALKYKKLNADIRFTIKQGEEIEKFYSSPVKEYGLIEHSTRTAFQWKHFKRNRNGFLKLTGTGEYITGPIKLKPDEIRMNGEKYNLANVDIYGVTDIPMEDFAPTGILSFKDPKQNFNPGSFTLNGITKEGFIAWSKPNDAGEYDAFFFTDSENGDVNVFYTSEGVSNVEQNITLDLSDYEPEDSFLANNVHDKEEKFTGYVITADDIKIEGQIQLSYLNKRWYATDVVLTAQDGSVTHYSNDGSLKKVVISIDGKEKEFINFESEYVEVLHRDGDLVLFRNPHPTTQSFIGNVASLGTGVAINQINAEIQSASLIDNRISSEVGIYKDGKRGDFTQEQNVNIYAKEYIILDEKTQRQTMYIPKSYFRELDSELMGCIEYLVMEKEDKSGLKEMKDPLYTLRFINENMNN